MIGHNDESDEEMIGLLVDTDHDASAPRPPKRKKKRTKRGTMKPLEVMHSSTARRLSDDKPSKFACQMGLMISFLSILLGVWIWSGQLIDEHTTTQLWNGLKLRDIKNWCLDKSEKCICENPLEPQHRIGYKTWEQAHEGNIRDALTASRDADIVLLGDSITEGWRGMSFGKLVDSKKPNIKVFESFFKESKGADFEGTALGIAGDKTFNLLWRLQNGEIPKELQPSVWWILIGTNDFGKEPPHCSPEVVVMGIKRVIAEVHRQRPGSTIVINSLLPRSHESMEGRLVDSQNPDRETIWQGIMEVNRQLRDHCAKMRDMVFFDATSIFVEQDEGSKGIDGMFIPKSLMYDYLHPTAEGYNRWGEEIVKQVHYILEASQDKGRLPLPARWWESLKQSTNEPKQMTGKV